MKGPRILIAGIGNIFLGDDAFGVEMARHLGPLLAAEEVRVVDFGIRGYDLAYALVEGYEAVVLVDATPRGEPPGTLYLIQPELPAAIAGEGAAVDAHSLNPVAVLQMAAALGGTISPLYLLGCEPKVLETEDGLMGLSPEVAAAIPRAAEMVRSLVGQLLRSPLKSPTGLVPAA